MLRLIFNYILVMIMMLLINITSYASIPYFKLEKLSDKVLFRIELPKNTKIYLSDATAAVNTMIKIDLSLSANLYDYQVIWPTPTYEKTKHFTHYYYVNEISIPIYLNPIDVSLPILLNAQISYIICAEQCIPVTQELEDLIYLDKTSPKTAPLLLKTGFAHSLLLNLFYAFIGGIILNFMPCVLPVLSLKLLCFRNTRDYKTTALFIFLGIVCSFFCLALISILFRISGKEFGLGMNFQSSEFIIFLTIIVTIFISSTLNKINIDLPSSCKNFLLNYRINGRYYNDFASGILATILSTPCSAPFLGTALAFTVASDSNIVTIAIFISASIGFAMPYLLLITCPSLACYISINHKWASIVKKFTGCLLVATLVWLCNILYDQIGLRPTIGLILLLILLKFVLEQQMGKIKIFILIMLIGSALYLPDMAYHEDVQHRHTINSVWRTFNEEDILRHVNDGKVVVVDITASWCAACRFNKLILWDRDKTVKLLNSDDIVAMRGDYTVANAALDKYISSNKSVGIPFNKVYGPFARNGIILPPIVTYADLLKSIESARFGFANK